MGDSLSGIQYDHGLCWEQQFVSGEKVALNKVTKMFQELGTQMTDTCREKD